MEARPSNGGRPLTDTLPPDLLPPSYLSEIGQLAPLPFSMARDLHLLLPLQDLVAGTPPSVHGV
jgi:hypothetical protein